MSVKYQNDDPIEVGEVEDAAAPEAVEVSGFGFPLYTSVLVSCIIAVFIVQAMYDPQGIGLSALSLAELRPSILAAGFVKPAFVNGEYWRLLTGAALHGGLIHIFFNSYAFYSFGRLFEFLSNRAHLAIVFVLAAAGGGVLSLIFMPEGISVGASGGVLGLISYLAVYAFKRRQFVSAEFRKNLLFNIGFVLIFGLVLFQVVDNYGHIGGLLVGAAYGAIQIPTDPYIDPRSAGTVTSFFGLFAMGLFIAVCIFSSYLIMSAAV